MRPRTEAGAAHIGRRRQPRRAVARGLRRTPRRTAAARPRARLEAGALAAGARARLRGFRQATLLAVALTAFLLLLFAPERPHAVSDAMAAPAQVPDTLSILEEVAVEDLQPVETDQEELRPDTLARAAAAEIATALHGLWTGFLRNLPKYVVAVVVLLLAWVTVRALRPLLRRVLRGWERANALVALLGFAVWLLAIGIAVSVLVGDIRALVGSLGLVGLALSWALQTPIESFTGWLINSFQGYYRVGDRVAVGEVFGDVHRIDVLTTTVWEIGSLEQPGFVQAEQPTGRLITFPNYEVLRGSIVNLTRDFPWVWDELTIPVGDRSDLPYARDLLRRLADEVVGAQMAEPARAYATILSRARLEVRIAERPEIFVSLDDSWTNLTIRYLVPARERRRWKSALAERVAGELNQAEHAERIVPVYPRRQIQLIGPDGRPREVPGVAEAE